MSKTKDLSYEEALTKLQGIVELLENKEVKIDELTDQVKEAKALVEYCRKKLGSTEEEIKKIIDPEED